MTPQPLQQTFLSETEFPLMSSPAVSPVKTSVQPGSAVGLRLSGQGFGPKSLDLLASWLPNSSLLRTSQICWLGQVSNREDGFQRFSQTWPNAGMMRSGKIYQLRPWAECTLGSVSGLWPTPTKTDFKDCGLSANSTQRQARDFLNKNFKSTKRTTMAYAAVYGTPMPVEFSEWLMGFPLGHTDLQPAEMP